MQNIPSEKIRLTQTVKKGGCAAKLPAGTLREVLEGLMLPRPPELQVGVSTLDDAAVWDLGDGRSLVQTLDFFTPIVDDARDFGAIAATNALSDVFAMGGDPKTCLTILAFPTQTLPLQILKDLMEGALGKIIEAGAALVGGHTIDDETLKLGFSVTGFVDTKKVWTNAGAKVGDHLILTKGLGTGTLMSALKEDGIHPEELRSAVKSMSTLNRARDLFEGISVHAATDVTGFGLAGHALQMAEASGVAIEFNTENLPALLGAVRTLEEGYTNRAHVTNLSYVEPKSHYDENVSAVLKLLTLDAQTSGGLLLAIPESQSKAALSALRKRFPESAVIGKVRNFPSEASVDGKQARLTFL
jgi:selenide, water dikinase